jgi:hypothetical protein
MVRGPIATWRALDRVGEWETSSTSILEQQQESWRYQMNAAPPTSKSAIVRFSLTRFDLDVTSLADFFTIYLSAFFEHLFYILHKAGIMLFYTVSAISMTLLNKSVLNHTPVPVTLMVCQSFVGWGLMRIVKAIGGRWGNAIPKWDWTVAKQLGPLVIVNVLGLT